MGDAAVVAAAKAIAYRLDPHAVVDRAARAQDERTVTIRPAPDTMTYVTALLPVAQGVSVYAALKREADVCFDGRTRGQAMADTLVERVTGRPVAQPVPVAVNLVISDQALLGVESAPAVIAGYGSVPSAVAQNQRRTSSPRPSQIQPRWRHCASFMPHPPMAHWWPWSRGRGCFRKVWPTLSAYVISDAAPPTATHPFGTGTTPHRIVGEGQPERRTGWECASGATTPKKRRGGPSPPTSMKEAGTQLNSPHRLARVTIRLHLRCLAPRRGRWGRSRFGSTTGSQRRLWPPEDYRRRAAARRARNSGDSTVLACGSSSMSLAAS